MGLVSATRSGRVLWIILWNSILSLILYSIFVVHTHTHSTAPQDYLSLTQSVFFAPSTTFQVVGVTITTDDIVESPERFLASLSLPSGSIGVTIRQPQTAEVIISDDDGKPHLLGRLVPVRLLSLYGIMSPALTCL